MWKFSCYTRLGGKNVIQDWYLSLSEVQRSNIYSALEIIKNLDINQLLQLRYLAVNGEKKSNIHEIRIKHKKIQYRIIGFFNEKEEEFIMLDAFQKHNKADNKRGFDLAKDRRREIEKDEKRKKEYDFRAD